MRTQRSWRLLGLVPVAFGIAIVAVALNLSWSRRVAPGAAPPAQETAPATEASEPRPESDASEASAPSDPDDAQGPVLFAAAKTEDAHAIV